MLNRFIKNIEEKSQECKSLHSIIVDEDSELDIFNIGSGAFYPLTGFMSCQDYHAVVNEMHLERGVPWTIPITLDFKKSELDCIAKKNRVCLKNKKGDNLAILHIEDVFKIDRQADVLKIYGANDIKHPGVHKEVSRNHYRIGGVIEVFPPAKARDSIVILSPDQARRLFKERGWKTITGFQTRNPIHRAHEYLQRIAMEITDGLFIHPLIGWKKGDDFSPEVVVAAYKLMVELFYNEKKVLLSFLKTPMRYAGPREAVFHAIIRKNFGCTHFIVGRDHAGVGGYYGKYEAHKIFDRFSDLGIQILKLAGPHYCRRCRQIVTENTCRHGKDEALNISGKDIRAIMKESKLPPEEYMRKEISELILKFYKKGRAFNENCA